MNEDYTPEQWQVELDAMDGACIDGEAMEWDMAHPDVDKE